MRKCMTMILCAMMLLSGSAAAITMEEARQIALEHAQLTEEEVTFFQTERDWENQRVVFDIEFMHGLAEYDYEIDEATGEILSFDNDAELLGDSLGEIDAAQALAIALEQAGLRPDEVRVIKTERTYDDGRDIFEIEFMHGRIEYECEIDIVSGRIVEWDRDD